MNDNINETKIFHSSLIWLRLSAWAIAMPSSKIEIVLGWLIDLTTIPIFTEAINDARINKHNNTAFMAIDLDFIVNKLFSL